MQKPFKTAFLLAIALAAASAAAVEPTSKYQGLISFRNGPDPAGRTPVYWATSQTLHVVQDPTAAERKFGSNWVQEIRWCGDSNGKPTPGECSDIYYNFKKGRPITSATTNLLHPER
jgi:hypothetical protein